eukprot:2209506-Alexandrium_andersonii.AAC.1
MEEVATHCLTCRAVVLPSGRRGPLARVCRSALGCPLEGSPRRFCRRKGQGRPPRSWGRRIASALKNKTDTMPEGHL